MNTICYIPASQEEISSGHLLIEIGDFGVSLIWYGKNVSSILGLAVYVFEEQEDLIDALTHIFLSKDIKNARPLSLKIAYNYKDSLLVPEKYYKEELSDQMLSLLFGENDAVVIKSDQNDELKLKNVYRIPSVVESIVKKYFPDTEIVHSTSLQIIKNHSVSFLNCIVFYDAIKLLLYINGQLHFVQQFKYSKPEDVTYFLLNTCQQHDMKPDEIHLKLCGMIVEDSNLYQHLYNYFLNIEFVGLPEGLSIRPEIESLPSHFFSHLIEMATCV